MFIIFPNQLFENNPYIMDRRITQFSSDEEKNQNICIIEDPLFFYDKRDRPFKIHKLKIAFLRAASKQYKTFLENKGYKNIDYLEYDDIKSDKDIIKKIKGKDCVQFLDPHDHELLEKYKKICARNNVKCEIIDDDVMFVLNKKDLDDFHKKHGKKDRIQHSIFFEFVKDKMDVLKNIKSKDSENRNALPSDFSMNTNSSKNSKNLKNTISSYFEDAIHFVENHKQFKKHYGNFDLFKENSENENKEKIEFPISHDHAKKYFETFLKYRFSSYGKYQDAVHDKYIILYHSHCSHLLNCGLLTPKYIIDKVLDAKGDVPMNSLEGFVRQLLGWREYMRYIYHYHYTEIVESNIFEMDKHIAHKKEWYEGTLGIEPIDNEIKKIQKTGYAHHIVRLMFLLNFMVLCHVKKEDIYQWFMEMIAMDAYPWVMQSNIAAMGLYSNKFMRKPYISSSNYITKMSNYSEGKKDNNDEKWDCIWDDLFYHFLKSKEELVKKYASVYTRNLAYYNKKSSSEKNDLQKRASHFIEKITNKR